MNIECRMWTPHFVSKERFLRQTAPEQLQFADPQGACPERSERSACSRFDRLIVSQISRGRIQISTSSHREPPMDLPPTPAPTTTRNGTMGCFHRSLPSLVNECKRCPLRWNDCIKQLVCFSCNWLIPNYGNGSPYSLNSVIS